MTVELTPTYIAKVRPDHTIELPEEMPIGATVMVIVVPATTATPEADSERSARFEATFVALKAAMDNSIPNLPNDDELSSLVEQARKSSNK